MGLTDDIERDVIEGIVTSQSENENFTCLKMIVALKNYVLNLRSELDAIYELKENKVQDVYNNRTSETKYPSVKSVYDYIEGIGSDYELKDNKSQDVYDDHESETKYPSVKAIYDYISEVVESLEEYIADEITSALSTVKTVEYINLSYTGVQVKNVIDSNKMPVLIDNSDNYYQLNKAYYENNVLIVNFFRMNNTGVGKMYVISTASQTASWGSVSFNSVTSTNGATVSLSNITSSSTDIQIPTSKRVYDLFSTIKGIEQISTSSTYSDITAILNKNYLPILYANNKMYFFKETQIIQDTVYYLFDYGINDSGEYEFYQFQYPNTPPASAWQLYTLQIVPDISTSISSSSTDSQIPTAKAVYDYIQSIL